LLIRRDKQVVVGAVERTEAFHSLEHARVSRMNTFRKPWRLLALFLPFFLGNFVVMNVMPFEPGAHWLGVLFFRAFWLVPSIGTIVCLRDAYCHRLRISGEQIELTTPRGRHSFCLRDPNFTVQWQHCRDAMVLKSRHGDSTIRFGVYKPGEKAEIIAILREKVPDAIQSGWDAFQSEQQERKVRARESTHRLQKYGPPMLLAFAGLFLAVAIQRREWHLLALVAINILVAVYVYRKNSLPSQVG